MTIFVEFVVPLLIASFFAITAYFFFENISKDNPANVDLSGIVFCVLLIVLVIGGVKSKEPDSVVVSINQVLRVKLLSMNPPKHFYVTFQTESGYTYKDVYVSKRCDNWQENTIGDWYNIEYSVHRKVASGDTFITFTNLNQAFC